MSALWRWPELCDALALPRVDGPTITGISIDSRTTAPGDLFIALSGDPGPRFNPSHRSTRDGHDFIDAAVARGAVGVLSHDGIPRQVPQLCVADTLDGLWQLGAAGRARLRGPVVAITGSSGKTTSKGFLAAALDGFATGGSLNNHLGVPLSLALTPAGAAAAVLELGTNHPGEIAPLARLVRPHVAVVLNVHPAHRENFPNIEAIRREKLSICAGLVGARDLILDESVSAAGVPEDVRVSRFGQGAGTRVQMVAISGATARYRIGTETLLAEVPGGGAHRALSLAAVLCVLDVLERDPRAACALSAALVPAGRGREHTAAGVCVLDDSYNANPASMRAALRSLAGHPGQRRVAVLGEMLELGEEGAEFHRGLADACAGLEVVYCVGAGMRALFEVLAARQTAYWQAEADEALLDTLEATLRAGDVVLVKGSNRVFWKHDYVRRLLAKLRASS